MVCGVRFQLYGKVVPNTVHNFVALLTGKNAAEVSYRGTGAYRVLSDLNIQVGVWTVALTTASSRRASFCHVRRKTRRASYICCPVRPVYMPEIS